MESTFDLSMCVLRGVHPYTLTYTTQKDRREKKGFVEARPKSPETWGFICNTVWRAGVFNLWVMVPLGG